MLIPKKDSFFSICSKNLVLMILYHWLQDLSKQYYEDLIPAFFEFNKLAQGNIEDMNWETTKPFYGNVAKDVGYQKKRIGGNFVVAQAITSRDMRNEIHIDTSSKGNKTENPFSIQDDEHKWHD